jgi:TRAP-type C4-dicarboxylate transport system substrate-binding protein
MAAPGVLAMNEKLFQKFTADQKALILKAADDAMDYHNELITKQQDDAIAELKRLGMTVIVPTDAAMNEWRTMAKNTLPKLFEDVWGAGMYDRIVNTK